MIMRQTLRIKWLFIFAMLLGLLLTGCGQEERIPTIGIPSPATEVNLTPGLSMKCIPEVLYNETTDLILRCTIYNDREAGLAVGHFYVLEYEKDGQWYQVTPAPSDQNFSVPEIAITYPPYSENEHGIDLERYGTYFPPGHYRVILIKGGKFEDLGYKSYLSDHMLSGEFYVE